MILLEGVVLMDNDIIRGYIISTLKSLNYSDKEIHEIEKELNYKLDILTEQQAKIIAKTFV